MESTNKNYLQMIMNLINMAPDFNNTPNHLCICTNPWHWLVVMGFFWICERDARWVHSTYEHDAWQVKLWFDGLRNGIHGVYSGKKT
jgi:hypothetical protein